MSEKEILKKQTLKQKAFFLALMSGFTAFWFYKTWVMWRDMFIFENISNYTAAYVALIINGLFAIVTGIVTVYYSWSYLKKT